MFHEWSRLGSSKYWVNKEAGQKITSTPQYVSNSVTSDCDRTHSNLVGAKCQSKKLGY